MPIMRPVLFATMLTMAACSSAGDDAKASSASDSSALATDSVGSAPDMTEAQAGPPAADGGIPADLLGDWASTTCGADFDEGALTIEANRVHGVSLGSLDVRSVSVTGNDVQITGPLELEGESAGETTIVIERRGRQITFKGSNALLTKCS